MTSDGSDNAIANIGLSGNIITVTTADSFEDKYNVLSYAADNVTLVNNLRTNGEQILADFSEIKDFKPPGIETFSYGQVPEYTGYITSTSISNKVTVDFDKDGQIEWYGTYLSLVDDVLVQFDEGNSTDAYIYTKKFF